MGQRPGPGGPPGGGCREVGGAVEMDGEAGPCLADDSDGVLTSLKGTKQKKGLPALAAERRGLRVTQ